MKPFSLAFCLILLCSQKIIFANDDHQEHGKHDMLPSVMEFQTENEPNSPFYTQNPTQESLQEKINKTSELLNMSRAQTDFESIQSILTKAIAELSIAICLNKQDTEAQLQASNRALEKKIVENINLIKSLSQKTKYLMQQLENVRSMLTQLHSTQTRSHVHYLAMPSCWMPMACYSPYPTEQDNSLLAPSSSYDTPSSTSTTDSHEHLPHARGTKRVRESTTSSFEQEERKLQKR